MPTIDAAVHIAELFVLLGIAGYARTAVRKLNVLTDYPPHLHVNGKIVFPKGMSPGVVERTEGQ